MITHTNVSLIRLAFPAKNFSPGISLFVGYSPVNHFLVILVVDFGITLCAGGRAAMLKTHYGVIHSGSYHRLRLAI